MNLRKFGERDIIGLANQLQHLKEWKLFHDFGKRFYGDTVHSMVFDVYPEYNDEGGYDLYMRSLRVYNVRGEELSEVFVTDQDKTDYYHLKGLLPIDEEDDGIIIGVVPPFPAIWIEENTDDTQEA